MNTAQLVTIGLSIALVAAAAYLMNMFFGQIGAILVTVFTLPVVGVVAYLSSQGGGQTSHSNMSKGARER